MIADIVRERGPLTVAAFMDLALYHPELGYYARAARRSSTAVNRNAGATAQAPDRVVLSSVA